MRRGYTPAVSTKAGASVVADIKTLSDFRQEQLNKIRLLPKRTVTPKELVRDLGFTQSGIRLLAKSKWLVPSANGGGRKVYNFQEALTCLLLVSGIAQAPQTRTDRKHTNIVTILRDVTRRAITT